jgi:polyadenylation factor subunit 2
MQGSQNQMMPQMPQHMMGLNQMHLGPVPPGNVPPMGGFPNGMGNIQGASGSSGMQDYPMGGMYNWPQGQMTSIPGLTSYQVRLDLLDLK